jgi:hypothetical protein
MNSFLESQSVEPLSEDISAYRDCFILCQDGLNGAGSFMFTKLLMKAVKEEGNKVVLLSASHSPEHYEVLFRKNSLDLRLGNLSKKMTMKFLVPQGSAGKGLISREEASRVEAANAYYPCAHYDWSELGAWVRAGEFVTKSTTDDATQQQQRTIVFIDDLNILESLAPSKAAARKLLSALLYSLHSSKQGQGGIDALVAAGPIETTAASAVGAQPAGGDGEEPYLHDTHSAQGPELTEVAKYQANVVASVLPLNTGFSNEVHGIVKLTATKLGQMRRESFAFKVQNPNSVTFVRLKKDKD